MRYSHEITVVIPTYNRPRYLERSLDYWGSADLDVIVADGSDEEYDRYIPPNVTYFYNNELTLVQRWINALQKVKTPYVVFCADDDFLSITGINMCLDYLKKFSDYASVQGLAVTFQIDNKRNISVELSNSKMFGHHIKGDVAIDRLNQLFEEYIYQIYSIHRLSFLQKAFEACKEQKNPNYIELAAAIVPTIFGKHKVLPVFYSARQNIPGSSSETFEVPRFDRLNPERITEYQSWQANIAKIYSEAEGSSLYDSMQIIEKTLTKYYEWDFEAFPKRKAIDTKFWSLPLGFIIKTGLKKVLPEPILWAKRRVYKKLRTIYSRSYPFTDAVAEVEWLKIANFIARHNTEQ